MPQEPNDKMEELLKAYARQRREEAGASMEIHPATRQMLQAEVRRLIPQKGTKSPEKRIFRLGHFIFASAATATFVLCATLYLQHRTVSPPPQQFVSNEISPGKSKIDTLAEIPPMNAKSPQREITQQSPGFGIRKDDGIPSNTGASSVSAGDVKLSVISAPSMPSAPSAPNNHTLATAGNLTLAPPASIPAPIGGSAAIVDGTFSAKSSTSAGAGGVATIAQNQPSIHAVDRTPQPAQPAPLQQPTGTETPTGSGVEQDGTGMDTGLAENKGVRAGVKMPNILATFEIQIEGDQIRLIDEDGSTYVGKFDPGQLKEEQFAMLKGQMFSNLPLFGAKTDGPRGGKSTVPGSTLAFSSTLGEASDAATSASPAMSDLPAAKRSFVATGLQQTFPFRVSGISRKLNQVVVVDGRCVVSVSPPGSQPKQNAGYADKKDQNKLDGDLVSETTGFRIDGEAQIGANRKMKINAVAVPVKALMKARVQE